MAITAEHAVSVVHLLTPDRRPRAHLRPRGGPDVSGGCSPGGQGRGATRLAPAPGRAAPGPERRSPAGDGDRGQPHRAPEHAAGAHREAAQRPRLDWWRRSASRTWCSPTWARHARSVRGAAPAGRGGVDELGDLAPVPPAGRSPASESLAALAVLMLVTGLHLRDVYDVERDREMRSRRLLPARSRNTLETPTSSCGRCSATSLIVAPVLARHVLGRAADLARARERDLQARLDPERVAYTLAGGEGSDRGRRGGRGVRALQPDVDVVGGPDPARGTEPLRTRASSISAASS